MKTTKKWLLNEIKLFSYNLRFIFKAIKEKMLNKRINQETYLFLLMGLVAEVVTFNIYLECIEAFVVISYSIFFKISFLFYLSIFIQLLVIWKKRLQDTTLLNYCRLLILSSLLLGGLKTFGHSFLFLIGKSKVTFFYEPMYIIAIVIASIGISFFPSEKKENEYGSYISEGIVLFNRLISYKRPKEMIQDESMLMAMREAVLKTIVNWSNFRGRTNRIEYNLSLVFYGFILCVLKNLSALLPNIIFFKIWGYLALSFIGVLTLSSTIRRLHDGYNSALWIVVFPIVPFTFYILVLLFLRDSWEYKEIKGVI